MLYFLAPLVGLEPTTLKCGGRSQLLCNFLRCTVNVCGARQNLRAFAFPRFCRPLHTKLCPFVCHRQRGIALATSFATLSRYCDRLLVCSSLMQAHQRKQKETTPKGVVSFWDRHSKWNRSKNLIFLIYLIFTPLPFKKLIKSSLLPFVKVSFRNM